MTKSKLLRIVPGRLAALTILAFAMPVHSATINVTADAVDDTVNGNCSLIEAIKAANDNAAVDTCPAGGASDSIVLPANSTYTFSQPYITTIAIPQPGGPPIPGPEPQALGFTALPAISTDITIEGNGSVIERDATSASKFRLLLVAKGGALTLNNVVVRNGHAAEDPSVTSGGFGGNHGGAILQDGDISNGSTLTVNNCVLTHNTAGKNASGNLIGVGGAITSYSALTISNSIISDNTAQNGGGILASGHAQVTGSTISANTADENGGGMVTEDVATIVNSTFSGNQANAGMFTYPGFGGGGIYASAGDISITFSTFTGNTANSAGGGLLYSDMSGGGETVTIENNIISGNSTIAGLGHDVAVYAPFITGGSPLSPYNNLSANSNVFGDSSHNTSDALLNFSPLQIAHNVLATSDGPTPTAIAGILNTTLDINDTSIKAAGADVKTHALAADSPAIDATQFDCPSTPTDQRGEPRPGGQACDAGAFEFQPPPDEGLCFPVKTPNALAMICL